VHIFEKRESAIRQMMREEERENRGEEAKTEKECAIFR